MFSCMKHARIQEFSSGGPGQSDNNKKALTTFFISPQLFTDVKMVDIKGNYHFSSIRRGSNIFQGGGGVQLLIPNNKFFSNKFSTTSFYLLQAHTHIISDFPGADSPPPPPPHGSALVKHCIWKWQLIFKRSLKQVRH